MKRVLPIISVYDKLLGYKSLFLEQNVEVASRSFTNYMLNLCEKEEGGDCIDVTPADLSLYHVGNFCLDSGEIEPINPCPIVHGIAVVSKYYNGDFSSFDIDETSEVKK